MEKKTKTGIEHLGSALALICRITRMVFVITGVVLLIGSVVSLSGSDLIRKVEWLYKQNVLYQILLLFAGIGSMEEKYAAAIGCFITGLCFFCTFLFYAATPVFLCFAGHLRKAIYDGNGEENPSLFFCLPPDQCI